MAERKTDRAAIAARMKLAREQVGLSQGHAAKKLGLHRPAVSEVEAGRRRVSAEELVKFAALYRVSVGWLAEGASDLTGEHADRISLAARELAKLKPEDMESVLGLLKSLRGRRDENS